MRRSDTSRATAVDLCTGWNPAARGGRASTGCFLRQEGHWPATRTSSSQARPPADPGTWDPGLSSWSTCVSGEGATASSCATPRMTCNAAPRPLSRMPESGRKSTSAETTGSQNSENARLGPSSFSTLRTTPDPAEDFERCTEAVRRLDRRSVPYLVWYPLLPSDDHRSLLETTRALAYELVWGEGTQMSNARMRGCGVVAGGEASRFLAGSWRAFDELAHRLGGRLVRCGPSSAGGRSE
jgi:hypothetical protein